MEWAARMGMLDGTVWDEHKLRAFDVALCIEMRRKTFGSDLTMSLSHLAHGQTVPPEDYRTRTIQSMESSTKDYACLLNDVFSCQKEIQFEGEIHNGVLVVQNFLNCDLDRALDIVNDLLTSRMRQFQHTVAMGLPAVLQHMAFQHCAKVSLITGLLWRR